MSVELTQVDNLINAGSGASIDDLATKSIVLRINFASLPGTGLAYDCFGKLKANDGGTQHGGWTLEVLEDGSLSYFNFWGGAFSGSGWRTAAGVIATGIRHIILKFDNSNAANDPVLIVDGATISMPNTSRQSGSRNSDANGELGICSRVETAFGTESVIGKVLEAALYGSILSAGDVTTLYNGGVMKKGVQLTTDAANLKGYWPMDDQQDGVTANGVGTIRDASGNGNTASGDDGVLNTGCVFRDTNVRVAALKITSNLPTSVRQVISTPSALTLSSRLTTPSPSLTVFPPAQIITGKLGTHVPTVSSLPAAFKMTANLTVPIPKVMLTPDALLLRLILNTVTLSGLDSGQTVTVQVPCLVLNAFLPTVGKSITISPDALSIRCVVNGVIPQLGVSPAALRLISSLGAGSPAITISAAAQKITATLNSISRSITIPVDALRLQAILNAVELIGTTPGPVILARRIGPKVVNFQNPVKITLATEEHAITNPKIEGV